MIRMTVGDVTLEADTPEAFLRIAASIPELAKFVRAEQGSECEPWCGLPWSDSRVPAQYRGGNAHLIGRVEAYCSSECRKAGRPVRHCSWFPR
jgi:hypothetical protein